MTHYQKGLSQWKLYMCYKGLSLFFYKVNKMTVIFERWKNIIFKICIFFFVKKNSHLFLSGR